MHRKALVLHSYQEGPMEFTIFAGEKQYASRSLVDHSSVWYKETLWLSLYRVYTLALMILYFYFFFIIIMRRMIMYIIVHMLILRA